MDKKAKTGTVTPQKGAHSATAAQKWAQQSYAFPTADKAMSYVLILTIISSFGSVDTQHVPGFDSYNECATHAVAWAESQRSLHPDSELRWATNSGRSILPQQLRQLGDAAAIRRASSLVSSLAADRRGFT
jgi:hypothetical protein